MRPAARRLSGTLTAASVLTYVRLAGGAAGSGAGGAARATAALKTDAGWTYYSGRRPTASATVRAR